MVMVRSVLFATAASLSLALGSASAQPAPMPEALYPDLPSGVRAPVLGVIPNVGPTPGYVLEAISPRVKCSQDAVRAAEGLMAPRDAVRTCNDAITSPITETSDIAGSHVNRGVLLLSMAQPQDARRDFERALEIDPNLAEALVNRGAMKIAEGRAAEGVADLDRAIALGTERPERAHYHRGLGREDMGDVRGAYDDYRMALTLKPDMVEAEAELSRFQIRRAAQ